MNQNHQNYQNQLASSLHARSQSLEPAWNARERPATDLGGFNPSSFQQAGALTEEASNLSTVVPVQSSSPSGGLRLPFKMDQIRSFFDRIGGMNGIMERATKVQSFFNSVQEVAPMLKLLVSSFRGRKNQRTPSDYRNRRRRRTRSRRGYSNRSRNQTRSGRSRRSVQQRNRQRQPRRRTR